jgi:hypothetical protein
MVACAATDFRALTAESTDILQATEETGCGIPPPPTGETGHGARNRAILGFLEGFEHPSSFALGPKRPP